MNTMNHLLYMYSLLGLFLCLVCLLSMEDHSSSILQLGGNGSMRNETLSSHIKSPPLPFLDVTKQLNQKALQQLYQTKQKLSPFSNPFHPSFFRVQLPKLTTGIIHPPYNPAQHCLERILYGLSFHHSIVSNETQLVDELQKGTKDIGILNEYRLDRLTTKESSRLRFVGSLYPVYLTCLVSTDLSIIDLSDLITWKDKVSRKLVINIPSQDEMDSTIHLLRHLFSSYGIDENQIKWNTSNEERLRRQYVTEEIDMVVRLSPHPSRLFQHLTSLRPSKLLTIRNIPDELLEDYPMIEKDMIQIESLRRFYPFLHFYNTNSLHNPSLSIRTNLIVPSTVSDGIVYYITNNIFLMIPLFHKIPYFNYKTRLSVSYSHSPLPFHSGAKEYYKDRNYYTTQENRHCILYKYGHCPLEEPKRLTRLIPSSSSTSSVSKE